MRSIRNEIKHIMRAVTVLTALFAMTFVLANSANSTEIGPLGNPAILRPSIGSQAFVRPPVFNPFFRPPIVNPFFSPPIFNPFFRPPVFNPFFRPPIFNPFFGADLDDVGLGFGVGIGGLGVGGFGAGIGEAD